MLKNKILLMTVSLLFQVLIHAKDQTFQLHEWVLRLKSKYPQANVSNVTWKMLPSNLGKTGFCYSPELKTVFVPSLVFQDKKSLRPYERVKFFDEFAALHELGHHNNKTSWPIAYKNNIKIGISILPFIFAGYCYKYSPTFLAKYTEKLKTWYETKSFNMKTAIIIGAVATAVYLTIGTQMALNAGFARIDEVLADQYARQHADTQALIEAYCAFTYCGLLEKAFRDKGTVISEWHNGYLVHPDSLDRAGKIQQELQKRYGDSWWENEKKKIFVADYA